jgi:SWI/SNF-related matrix-associated actin-dependent regulator 1 of chromatin subfamily A
LIDPQRNEVFVVLELFSYQREGAEWLSQRKVALLADEMGVGKTAQAITAADLTGAKRVLVLCPAVARLNWLREFTRFSKRTREWIVMRSAQDRVSLLNSVITSYDLATRASEKLCGPWDTLILDEAHYLKSTETKRSLVVWGKQGLVRRAERVWALSGTPAPNHAGELWPLLYSFGVTPLTYQAFIDRYCNGFDSGFGYQITGTKAERVPELKAMLSRVMLRRRKQDVLADLPPIFYSRTVVEAGHVEIGPEIDRLKREERRLADAMALAESSVDEAMAALEGLAQSLSTLRRYSGLRKVAPVVEMISGELELGLYDKVVIFAIHKDVVAGLRHALAAFNPVVVDGGTPISSKQLAVDAFQTDDRVQIFIGNIQAAGTNLTLTAAHHVVIVEEDWVPANNAQAAMRCHRIGQAKPVTVRFVSLATPLDERVASLVERKTRELSKIFDLP